MSQMSQIRSLYRALFRRSANIYVSKLRFAVVWLGQIHNFDTVHVYVLGLKSASERLTVSHFGEHKRLHLESSKQDYCIISLMSNNRRILHS